MPPFLALLLGLIFIAWLLIRDIRFRPTVSNALWLPTILLVILGSRAPSLWFHGPSAASGDGDPLDQLFYLSLLAASVLVASRRGVKWSKLFGSNLALTTFYLYFAVSVLWSEDPFSSSKRWIKDCGNLAVIAVVLSEQAPLDAIRAVYVRAASLLLPLSVVYIRYFPELGRSYGRAGEQMFTGVTTQKNSLGEMVLIMSVLLIWDCLETRAAEGRSLLARIPWVQIILLSMGIWLLNMSESKTSMMCLVVAAALMFGSKTIVSRPLCRGLLFGVLSLPFLLSFTEQFIPALGPLVEALGRDLTFTGRTSIWTTLLTEGRVNPFFGAGFFNFWGSSAGDEVRLAMGAPGLHSAHNGYIDIFLDGGIVGLFVLFGLLLTRGNRLVASINVDRFQRLKFAVLIIVIVYNVSESTFARLSLTWFTLLLAMIDFKPAKATVPVQEEARSAAAPSRLPTINSHWKPRKPASVEVRS